MIKLEWAYQALGRLVHAANLRLLIKASNKESPTPFDYLCPILGAYKVRR